MSRTPFLDGVQLGSNFVTFSRYTVKDLFILTDSQRFNLVVFRRSQRAFGAETECSYSMKMWNCGPLWLRFHYSMVVEGQRTR
jgi:hypothetical protein